ncbi:hypothetical protein D3C86_1207770 [compost metagenome]
MRQGAHFARDDGEATALLARARRFHGGVERQDIGLEGDAVNHARDIGDTARTVGDRAHGLDHAFDHLAASYGDARRLADQAVGFTGVVGVLLHGAGQFFHRGGGFFQRRGLLFGALRKIGVALGDLRRCRRDALAAVAHVLDDAGQAFVHGFERAHQVAGFIAGGDLYVRRQVSRGHLARGLDRLVQRTHDAARDQPAQQHADDHAHHRQEDHDGADRDVQIRTFLHGLRGGLLLADRQARHQVVELLRRRDHALLDLGHPRIALRQRLRLGRLEERRRFPLPDLFGFRELRQQALAFLSVEIRAGLFAQRVHVLDGVVELLAQRLALLVRGRGQIGVARAARVDQIDIGFFHVRDAAQLGIVKPVVHFIDASQPPHAKGPDRTAYHRHQQKCTRQASADAQPRK